MGRSEQSQDLADLLSEMNRGGSGIEDLRQRTQQHQAMRASGETGTRPVKKKPRANYMEEDLRMIVRQQERKIGKMKKIIDAQRKEIATLRSEASSKGDSGLIETGEWQSKAFKVRRRLEDIPNRRNPAKQFWMLKEVQEGLSNLNAEEAKLSLADREYIHQCRTAYEEMRKTVYAQFKAEEINLLKDIRQTLKRVTIQIAELNDLSRGDWDPNAQVQGAPTYSDRMSNLATDIKALEDKAKSLDTITFKHIPGWDKIVTARSELLEMHQRDIFALKCAIMVAKADGRLASTETEFLIEMAENIRMGFDEAKQMILKTHSVNPHEFVGSEADALEVIRDAAACAFVDNLVPEPEYDMVQYIGKMLGVSEQEVEAILDEED